MLSLFLSGSHGDGHHPSKHLIEYITTNGFLQNILVITLVVLAVRLIADKKKDYAPFFINY